MIPRRIVTARIYEIGPLPLRSRRAAHRDQWVGIEKSIFTVPQYGTRMPAQVRKGWQSFPNDGFHDCLCRLRAERGMSDVPSTRGSPSWGIALPYPRRTGPPAMSPLSSRADFPDDFRPGLPMVNGKPRNVTGKLGAGVSLEEGQRFADGIIGTVNILAQAQAALGDLGRIRRCVKLGGLVSVHARLRANSTGVVNGALRPEIATIDSGVGGKHALAADRRPISAARRGGRG